MEVAIYILCGVGILSGLQLFAIEGKIARLRKQSQTFAILGAGQCVELGKLEKRIATLEMRTKTVVVPQQDNHQERVQEGQA